MDLYVPPWLSLSERTGVHLSRSGPVISPAAKKRVCGLIASAEEQGGRILLDGRNIQVAGYPDGNFVGPTVLEATTDMRCYKYGLFRNYHDCHIDERLYLSERRSLVRSLLFSQPTRSTMRSTLSTRTGTATAPQSSRRVERPLASSRVWWKLARLVLMCQFPCVAHIYS